MSVFGKQNILAVFIKLILESVLSHSVFGPLWAISLWRYPGASRQATETVALPTVKSLTVPGDGLCAAQGNESQIVIES